MKKIMITASAVASVLLANISHAQISAENIALAKEAFAVNTCVSCHDATSRVVGPSMKELSKRYKGKKIETELAARIRNGTSGRWGDVPHPAYEAMDEKTSRLIAAWIIAGAPQ